MLESRLSNKVAVITGAANGIGREMSLLFTKHLAKIIIIDIDEDGLYKTKQLVEVQGGVVLPIVQDISDESAWKETIKQIEDTYDHIDILINNAGVINRKGVNDIPMSEFKKVHAINVDGTFLGLKYGVKLIKSGGSIVNISSASGIVGSPASVAYHSSKGAVRLMTKSAALEFAQSNIRVNSIHPGVIETQMSGATDNNHSLKHNIPMKRIGDTQDIAYGALFLASDESKYITGTELIIDGGYTAQ